MKLLRNKNAPALNQYIPQAYASTTIMSVFIEKNEATLPKAFGVFDFRCVATILLHFDHIILVRIPEHNLFSSCNMKHSNITTHKHSQTTSTVVSKYGLLSREHSVCP